MVSGCPTARDVDPEKLRALLAVLTEAGVRRAEFDGETILSVEFGAPAKVPRAELVDPVTGNAVNLDDGAPELADASVDDEIAAKNFDRGKS